MRTFTWSILVVAMLTVSCSVAVGGPASRVWAPDTRVGAVEVVADKSDPTKFTMAIEREMPTPGWTFLVDAIEAEPAASRLTIKLTEVGPDGMVAQVLTPARIEVPLGQVEPGSYFVEVWTRRNPAQPHRPGLALIILAR